MGLRNRIRRYLVSRGYPVPRILVREHDRVFHETLARVRPGMVVVDIGAHRGETSAAFAARGATVHAFEPNADIYPMLVEAARRYPAIHHHQAAVLDANAEMRLYLHRDYGSDPEKHSESSSLLSEKPNLAPESFHVVPVRDVADIVSGIGRTIDIMKIDAEGAEYRILRRLIASGAIGKIGTVYVEPHIDRIPGLADEHADVAALIAERGLGARIRFDWA